MSDEEYQLYKKVSPNYVVVLIKKVLDDALNADMLQEQELTPLEQFYNVSTYCHIHYLPNNTIHLQGLYKVKIEDMEPIEMEKNQPFLESPQNLEDDTK